VATARTWAPRLHARAGAARRGLAWARTSATQLCSGAALQPCPPPPSQVSHCSASCALRCACPVRSAGRAGAELLPGPPQHPRLKWGPTCQGRHEPKARGGVAGLLGWLRHLQHWAAPKSRLLQRRAELRRRQRVGPHDGCARGQAARHVLHHLQGKGWGAQGEVARIWPGLEAPRGAQYGRAGPHARTTRLPGTAALRQAAGRGSRSVAHLPCQRAAVSQRPRRAGRADAGLAGEHGEQRQVVAPRLLLHVPLLQLLIHHHQAIVLLEKDVLLLWGVAILYGRAGRGGQRLKCCLLESAAAERAQAGGSVRRRRATPAHLEGPIQQPARCRRRLAEERVLGGIESALRQRGWRLIARDPQGRAPTCPIVRHAAPPLWSSACPGRHGWLVRRDAGAPGAHQIDDGSHEPVFHLGCCGLSVALRPSPVFLQAG
jgi:hypothetical protein